MSPGPTRTALVTGANRGIGLATARALAERGLRVLLGARDRERGEEAAAALAGAGRTVVCEELDVADPESVRSLVRRLEADGVAVDVLVNNAGNYPQGGLLEVDDATLARTLAVHVTGPLQLCRALLPPMARRGHGRVVNVSSGIGSMDEGLGGPGAYALAKAAMNAMTLQLSTEVCGDVKVNAVCPGWVRTRMGGSGATRSVEEGADSVVWLATLGPDGPSGGFFRDRTRIPW